MEFKVGDRVKSHLGEGTVLWEDGRWYRVCFDGSGEHTVHCSSLTLLAPKPTLHVFKSEAPKQALRYNEGKPEMFYADLFPAALAGVSRTLEFGTKRKINPYPKFNWRKGAPATQLYNCARRHMLAWLNGQDSDADALAQGWDISNLDFAIGNLMRLRQQIADGLAQFDDRPGSPTSDPDSDVDDRIRPPST